MLKGHGGRHCGPFILSQYCGSSQPSQPPPPPQSSSSFPAAYCGQPDGGHVPTDKPTSEMALTLLLQRGIVALVCMHTTAAVRSCPAHYAASLQAKAVGRLEVIRVEARGGMVHFTKRRLCCLLAHRCRNKNPR